MALSLTDAYLFLYNISLATVWTYTLIRLVAYHLFLPSIHSLLSAYQFVSFHLKCTQTAAILEIFHSIIGLVRVDTFATVLQVSSRLGLLWGVVDTFQQQMESRLALSIMIAAWCTTEIPRYLYFAVSIWEAPPQYLTWLRYSTFIPMYPIGAGSEMCLLYVSLPLFQATRIYNHSLPNQINFNFYSYHLAWAALLAYIPGQPYMYRRMLKQRSEFFSPDVSAPSTPLLQSAPDDQPQYTPDEKKIA